MAKVLQHRRGTTAEHANFTGAAGEVTVDTTDKRLVVHDGSTKGGVPAAKKSEIVDAKSELQQAINNAVAEIGGTIDTIEGSIAELRKHNVGEEWVSYSGVIPQGGVPYLGQEVSRELYADLWQWARDNSLVTSEAQWQSNLVRDNGNVRQFSNGDGSTTFRMPRIVGYVRGASSLDEAGSYIKEGLPDHTHHIGIYDAGGSANGGGFIPATSRNAGSVIVNSGTNGESGNGNWTDRGQNAGYDTARDQLNRASAENAIYGNSSHVTPETSVVLFGVYAFGEVTNAGSVDVQSVANAIARVETSYLPLSGGTMTGAIYGSGGVIRGKTDASDVWISGGTNSSSNSYIQINGGSRTNQAGDIVLVPKTPTSSYSLRATASGVLTWGGKNIAVVDSWRNGSSWYRKWSDGFIEQGGFHNDTNNGSGTNSRTCTLHTPFTRTDYNVSRCITGVGGNDAGSVQPKGFGTLSRSTSSYTYSYPVNWTGWEETWYACGY